jgi:hypothetical protein
VPRLIGITGLPGRIIKSGKDTTADIAIDVAFQRSLSAQKRSLADAAKLSIAELFDIPREDVDVVKFDGKIVLTYPDPTQTGVECVRELDGRDFIIRYCEDAHRKLFGRNFWIDKLLPISFTKGNVDGTSSPPEWHQNFEVADVCLMPDLRFDEEADRIRALGGEIWVVERNVHNERRSEQGIHLQGRREAHQQQRLT